MSWLAFKNNAMFLQSMRQRMRLPTVISFAILTFIILSLIFSNASVNSHRYLSVNLEIFQQILNAQLFLLLGLGSWNVFQAAVRERVVGTLEFHRSSPTPAFWQMIGLLLGAVSLEWIIFLVTVPISLVISIQTPLGFSLVVQVYVAVVLCALLFHMVTLFLGLLRIGKLQNRKMNFSGVFFFIVFYIFSHMLWGFASYGMEVRKVSAHLTCFPVLSQVYEKAQENIYHGSDKKYPQQNRYYQDYRRHKDVKSMFYKVEMSPLSLQIILLLPLLYLLTNGIIRLLKQPHAPPFSKGQQLIGLAYIFFIFLADVYIEYVHPKIDYYGPYSRQYDTFFIFGFGLLVLICAVMGIFMSTPSRLSYLIGVKKSSRMGRKLTLMDDHNSCFFWLAGFIVIILSYFLMLKPLLSSIDRNFYSIILIILLIQISAIAGSWEAFILSRYGSSPILFGVGLSILWIFMPIFGSIFNGEWSRPYYHEPSILQIFSPFYLESLRTYGERIWLAFIVNMILAVSVWLLAFKQKEKLKIEKA